MRLVSGPSAALQGYCSNGLERGAMAAATSTASCSGTSRAQVSLISAFRGSRIGHNDLGRQQSGFGKKCSRRAATTAMLQWNRRPELAGEVPRVVVITSGKGGVGKTTTTANLGMCLARLNFKVVAIDADVGLEILTYSSALRIASITRRWRF